MNLDTDVLMKDGSMPGVLFALLAPDTTTTNTYEKITAKPCPKVLCPARRSINQREPVRPCAFRT